MARQINPKPLKRRLTPRQETLMQMFRTYGALTAPALKDLAQRIELHAPDTGTLLSLYKRNLIEPWRLTFNETENAHVKITVWKLTDFGLYFGIPGGM